MPPNNHTGLPEFLRYYGSLDSQVWICVEYCSKPHSVRHNITSVSPPLCHLHLSIISIISILSPSSFLPSLQDRNTIVIMIAASCHFKHKDILTSESATYRFS